MQGHFARASQLQGTTLGAVGCMPGATWGLVPWPIPSTRFVRNVGIQGHTHSTWGMHLFRLGLKVQLYSHVCMLYGYELARPPARASCWKCYTI